MAAYKGTVKISTDDQLLQKYREVFKKSKKDIIKAMKSTVFVTNKLTLMDTFSQKDIDQIIRASDTKVKCLKVLTDANDLDKYNKFVRALLEYSTKEGEKIFPFVKDLPYSLCPPYRAYEMRAKIAANSGGKRPSRHVLVITCESPEYDYIHSRLKPLGGCRREEEIWGEGHTYTLGEDDAKACITVIRLWRMEHFSSVTDFYPARIVILCVGCSVGGLPRMGPGGRVMGYGDCLLVERVSRGGGVVRAHNRVQELKFWNLQVMDGVLAALKPEPVLVDEKQRELVTDEKVGFGEPRPSLCGLSSSQLGSSKLHFASELPSADEELQEVVWSFYSSVLKASKHPKQGESSSPPIYFTLAFLKLQNGSHVNCYRTFPTLLQQVIRFWFIEAKKQS